MDSSRQTRRRYPHQEEQGEAPADASNDDDDLDADGGSPCLNAPPPIQGGSGGGGGGGENEAEERNDGVGPLHRNAHHCTLQISPHDHQHDDHRHRQWLLFYRGWSNVKNASFLSLSSPTPSSTPRSPTTATATAAVPTWDQAGTLGHDGRRRRRTYRNERRATALVVALAAASTAVTVSFFLHGVHHPGRRTGTAATTASAGTRMDTVRRDADAPPSVGDVVVQQSSAITDRKGDAKDHDEEVLQSETMIPFVLGAHRLSRSITSQKEEEHGRSTASTWFPRIGPNVGNADALRQIPLVVASTGADWKRAIEPWHVPCRRSLINATARSTDATACPYDDDHDDDLSFVGFVRITKTASTAMLSFLNGLVPQQLVTYDHLIHYRSFFREVAGNDFRTMRSIIPACVFGSTSHATADADAGATNNETGAALLPAYAWQCPHTTYRGVVTTWARGLPFLRNTTRLSINQPLAEEEDDVVASSPAASSASLHMFTVVREPTDRFVSYFHYWRQIYPHWKELATIDEHDRMVQGDLEGFLELQSQLSTSPLTINSAFQYRYLNENVDEAIAMVQSSPVRVLVLVNECFELSLRLLAATFPHLVTQQDVDAFVQQTSHQKYTQGNASIPIVLRATSDVRPVQPIHMDELRNKSRTWLHDDYRFYRAAVNQFRQSIEASTLDPDLVRECYRRLDQSS